MKKSKFDPIIVATCTALLYWYLILGHGVWHDTIDVYGVKQDVVYIHMGIVYSSMFAVLFSLLYVFADALYPVNRHFFIRGYHQFKKAVRAKIDEGKREHREFMERIRKK